MYSKKNWMPEVSGRAETRAVTKMIGYWRLGLVGLSTAVLPHRANAGFGNPMGRIQSALSDSRLYVRAIAASGIKLGI